MAYVTVPKDLTKIKSKMLFGLTKRQLVCFGLAALIGVPLFFLSKGSMGTTPAALCTILVMLPFFLFALYEKNGQTPEALLGNLIQCKFTRPKKRVYQTNNAYSALEKQAELDARTIVSESETLQRARMKSAEIIHRAEERTGELYRVANSYTEDALRRTEEAIQMALDEVRQSRTRFRAASNEQMQQIRSGSALAQQAEETVETDKE